ncbi:hypothetical protein B0H11DRAFT_2320165 [Mycena galericulata]|nr:hypothetical protein B0H11DRAFT_2320165 [Mycena galericulata]
MHGDCAIEANWTGKSATPGPINLEPSFCFRQFPLALDFHHPTSPTPSLAYPPYTMVALQPRFLVLLALCVVASSVSLPSDPKENTHLAPNAVPTAHAVPNSPGVPKLLTKMVKRAGSPPVDLPVSVKIDKRSTPAVPALPVVFPKPAVLKADSKADKSALPAKLSLPTSKTDKRSTPAVPTPPAPSVELPPKVDKPSGQPASPAKPPAPNAVKPEEPILSALPIPKIDKRSQSDSPLLSVTGSGSEKRDDTDPKFIFAALPVRASTQPNDSLQVSESEGQKHDSADPKAVFSKLPTDTQSKPDSLHVSGSEGQKRDATPNALLTPPTSKVPSLPTKRSTESVPQPLEHPPIERQRFSRAKTDIVTDPAITIVEAATGDQLGNETPGYTDTTVHTPTAAKDVAKNQPDDVAQVHGQQQKRTGFSSKDVDVNGTGEKSDQQLAHFHSEKQPSGEQTTSDDIGGNMVTVNKQTMKRSEHSHIHEHIHEHIHLGHHQ